MSESLRVELNGDAVHAIDAPETFTAHGPFYVDLANAGGAVHVHLHLDESLSRVARLEGGNHFVEGGERNRIPVGIVPGRGAARGRLRIVSGYGTETEHVEVTVEPRTAERDERDRPAGTVMPERTDGSVAASESASGPSDGGDRASQSPPADERTSGPSATNEREDDAEATVTPTRRSGGRAESPSNGDRGTNASVSDAGGALTSLFSAVFDSESDHTSVFGTVSRDDVAFVALALVALLVGLAVIVAVREVVLALVVVAVLTGALAVAGWLLLS